MCRVAGGQIRVADMWLTSAAGLEASAAMSETSDGLDALDRLLQASAAQAGRFLRESFEIPAHSMDARHLSALFDRSRTVALATVTSRGLPRVAPVSAFLHGASFCIPTVADAARCKHVKGQPASSLTCFEGDWAVLAHGASAVIHPRDADFPAIEMRAQRAGLSSVLDWGEGVYLRMEPSRLFTWMRDPYLR
jgi:hypothetical protein